MFSGSKYPKNILFNFENRSTGVYRRLWPVINNSTRFATDSTMMGAPNSTVSGLDVTVSLPGTYVHVTRSTFVHDRTEPRSLGPISVYHSTTPAAFSDAQRDTVNGSVVITRVNLHLVQQPGQECYGLCMFLEQGATPHPIFTDLPPRRVRWREAYGGIFSSGVRPATELVWSDVAPNASKADWLNTLVQVRNRVCVVATDLMFRYCKI